MKSHLSPYSLGIYHHTTHCFRKRVEIWLASTNIISLILDVMVDTHHYPGETVQFQTVENNWNISDLLFAEQESPVNPYNRAEAESDVHVWTKEKPSVLFPVKTKSMISQGSSDSLLYIFKGITTSMPQIARPRSYCPICAYAPRQ